MPKSKRLRPHAHRKRAQVTARSRCFSCKEKLFVLPAHSQHREALTLCLGHFLLMPLENRVFSPVSPLCKTRSLLLSPLTGPVLQTYHERSWHNSVPTAFNSASLQTAEKRAPSLRPKVPQTAPSSSARIKAMLHLTFPGSRSNSPGAACTLRARRTEWQHKGSHGPWWLSSPARDSRSLR